MKNDLVERDLKCLWHPYTQTKDCELSPPIPITAAEGVKLYDRDGKFYYDTISSWWCNVHGHGHPAIKAAIKKQTDTLGHVLFAGFTHEGAVELAERLVSITTPGLKRVFYSDNGSTAVETALKMSVQYWQNVGKSKKNSFLVLDMGYHGDTAGAMSVGGEGLFNEKFRALCFETFKTPTPYCYRCPVGRKKGSCALECLIPAEDILKAHVGSIAAVVAEPVLMGAAGMIVYPPEFLKGLRELSLKYGVHMIADEVATGFGRTGKMFACEHAGITPDFMCLSKGITSGWLPLGATLTTEDIFQAFYGDHGEMKTFYHGHTFTANPVACAAAIASIDLFKKEDTLTSVGKIEAVLAPFLEEMSALSIVGDVRGIGTVAAIELVKNKDTKERFSPGDRVGMEIYRMGLERNLLLRPLGDVVYLFLPLCIKREELDDVLERVTCVLRDADKKAAEKKVGHL